MATAPSTTVRSYLIGHPMDPSRTAALVRDGGFRKTVKHTGLFTFITEERTVDCFWGTGIHVTHTCIERG